MARPAPPSLISPRESCTSPAQPLNEDIDLVRNDHKSVPPARLRIAARLTTAPRTWGAEVQRQIVAQQRGELARIVLVDLEIEIASIERDRLVDVRNDVSDGCHSNFLLCLVATTVNARKGSLSEEQSAEAADAVIACGTHRLAGEHAASSFDEPSHMNILVVVTEVGQPANEVWIAVIGKDHRHPVEIGVVQAMRVLSAILQRQQIDVNGVASWSNMTAARVSIVGRPAATDRSLPVDLKSFPAHWIRPPPNRP